MCPAKLFDRRKTRYLLTEAGQRVADSAEAMESTIVANQEAVGGSRAHTARSGSAPPTVSAATFWPHGL